jgi:hypothetical protein
MAVRAIDPSELARQPIGYWSGHTHRTVVGQIRADLNIEGLTQPTWWILNHVAGAPATWTPAALTERLHVFDDQATDFVGAFSELDRRSLLVERHDGALELTELGVATLGRSRERSAATLRRTMAGISDGEYIAALDVLRRIIDNLGGDSDIP